MDFVPVWNHMVAVIAAVPRSGILVATLAALMAGAMGSLLLRRRQQALGHWLRGGSTLMLGMILVLVVLQLSRMDPRLDMAMEGLGLPAQVVEGGETRIPLAPDGHFWVMARINGYEAPFMIDTGATLTAVSPKTAQAARLEPRRGGIPIQLETANGPVAAHVATVDKLSFGNVTARGLDAVIAPNMGETNVLGMNMLSRLGQWRMENGNMLILVPNKTGEDTN